MGDIILTPPCKKAPYGFLRKITSRTVNSGIISYQTEQASLNEAFEQLNIDATFDGNFDITKKGRQNLIGEGSLTYNFLNNSTFFPGIKINGSAKANISDIKFKYQKKKDSPLPSYILIKVDMNSTGSEIDVTTQGSGVGIKTPEVTYADYFLPDFYILIPITTPIGIIILPIRCVQKFSLNGGPLTINGKAKWNILPSINGVLGMEYNNGNWKNLSTFSIDPKANQLLRGDFNPDLSMNASFILINPKYEFSPYGADVIKFYAEAPAEITYTGQLQKPQYSLKFNLSVKAGLTSKFWINKEPEPPVSIQISEKTILEGNWPAPEPFSLSIVSGNNQNTDANKALTNPLVVLVKDNKGLPLSGVSVAWNVTSAGGKIKNDTTLTNANGQASNTWTVGATGTQKVTATVKKSDGSNITNSPITFNAGNYKIEYVSGNGQTYGGGGMPFPMVFKIKNVLANTYETNLSALGLTLAASADIGYQDADFYNSNQYCAQCFRGYYYIPSNSGKAPFTLKVTVTLKQNGNMIDSYIIQQNIN